MIKSVPKHIIIVGGGTAGWMTASLMAHKWQNLGIQISLIESSEIGTVGVGEGSTPYLKEFFETLAIPERKWMPACHATFKCGIRFPDWSNSPNQPSYFHPFYSDLDGPFAQPFFRACDERRHGLPRPTNPDHYFFTSLLAEQNKAPKSNTRTDYLNYGYHFDANLLGKFLKRHAISLGVRHIDDLVQQVYLDKRGNISILSTQRSGPLRGDFFVDCSGFKGLLIQKALGEQLHSYEQYLFCDNAVALPSCLADANIKPETISKALSHGWMWNIPLANRYGNGYVYSSKYISKEEAEKELRQALQVPDEQEQALHLKWVPGRIERHWHRNCVAVGLSQGFLEPLEAPMLYIIQRTIEGFIEHFTNGHFSNELSDNFNQELNHIIDGTRDYQQAHYKLNNRSDSQFWLDCRENPNMSKPLADILNAWSKEGNFDQVLAKHQQKLAYLKTSWYCVLAGHNYFPNNLQETNEMFPEVSIQKQLAKLSGEYIDHQKYLKRLYTQ